MGSFDGAAICELVGLYLLNILKKELGGKNIGLYRDDGLSCFENKSGPELEKIEKKICKIFKDNGLNIIIETNLHITEYLDVTFNLIIRIGNKIIIYNIFIRNLTIHHQ